MPAYDRAVPPREWLLFDDGRVAARRLTAYLPAGAHLAASDEPKAWQTLEGAGEVTRDARFGEVRREGEPWDGFRELRRAYVDGAERPGWEPRAEVAARLEAAVEYYVARVAGRPLVVASHGMVVTVWLTARIGLAAPGLFWADLRLPDVIVVDLAARTVTRLPRLRGRDRNALFALAEKAPGDYAQQGTGQRQPVGGGGGACGYPCFRHRAGRGGVPWRVARAANGSGL
jgi:broad specificity phosphatase PhoE